MKPNLKEKDCPLSLQNEVSGGGRVYDSLGKRVYKDAYVIS